VIICRWQDKCHSFTVSTGIQEITEITMSLGLSYHSVSSKSRKNICGEGNKRYNLHPHGAPCALITAWLTRSLGVMCKSMDLPLGRTWGAILPSLDAKSGDRSLETTGVGGVRARRRQSALGSPPEPGIMEMNYAVVVWSNSINVMESERFALVSSGAPKFMSFWELYENLIWFLAEFLRAVVDYYRFIAGFWDERK
jgi:hypothetical protein